MNSRAWSTYLLYTYFIFILLIANLQRIVDGQYKYNIYYNLYFINCKFISNYDDDVSGERETMKIFVYRHICWYTNNSTIIRVIILLLRSRHSRPLPADHFNYIISLRSYEL